jgi:hypothetical protein
MLVNEVFWNEDGALKSLFTAPYTFRNAALQKYYGEGTVKGEFQKVDTDPARRLGVLGLGGLAALKAGPDASNPVTRGKFVREVLICQDVPPPPADQNVFLPKSDPKVPTTARERLAGHSQTPLCAGCHKFMDPLGLAFENFDGSGKWRDQENGKTIDPNSELSGTDKDGPFAGATGLASKLGSSTTAQACAAQTWFRYAFGRTQTPADKCTMDALKDRFVQAGGKMKPFLLDLVATDAFLTRTVSGGTP